MIRRNVLSLLLLVVLVSGACDGSEDAVPPTVADGAPTTAEATSTTAPPTPTSVADTSTSTTTSAAATEPPSTVPLSEVRLALEPFADGFDQPVLLTHAGDERVFVVDQPGRIWVIDGDGPRVFLDIRERVTFRNERGLLGLAFHPDYGANGRFYVDYIDTGGDTVVSEFVVTDDPNVADPDSEREVLSVRQPAGNHNGGMIAFGPDGMLWIGMGDGGASDDRFGNGQRGDTVLGAMLRIEVGPDLTPYGVPDGNDFEAAEVWAIGLRNPWRFSFDGDDLWIADVGQDDVEEVDLVSATDHGLNFGWPIMEGAECFPPGSSCDPTGLTLPVDQYRHGEGCSITGGYVYRGAAIPSLAGQYFYSDYCSGFLRSIGPGGTTIDWTDQVGATDSVTSFGVDVAGELYVLSASGTIDRLVQAAP